MSCTRPILVGCPPSSGSTLLSVMLDAHPEIFCGPELSLLSHPAAFTGSFSRFRSEIQQFLRPASFRLLDPMERLKRGYCPYSLLYDDNLSLYEHDHGSLLELLESCSTIEEFLESFFQPLLQQNGKSIWAEKSPTNLYALHAFLDRFPEGRVIYLVRNGLDCVSSLLKRGFGFKRAVSIWLLETALCERLRGHRRAFRIRYEDLVLRPQNVLGELAEFLNVAPAVDRMLNPRQHSRRFRSDPTISGPGFWKNSPGKPISSQSIDRWRDELSRAQLHIFLRCRLTGAVHDFAGASEQRTAELLERLNYSVPTEDEAPTDSDVIRLLDRELFLLSGRDYAGTHCFQERFVEFDADGTSGGVPDADQVIAIRTAGLAALRQVVNARLLNTLGRCLVSLVETGDSPSGSERRMQVPHSRVPAGVGPAGPKMEMTRFRKGG